MSSALGGLTVARAQPPSPSSSTPPRRRHLASWLAVILLIAVLAVAWLVRDRLTPALPVTVAAVIAAAPDAAQRPVADTPGTVIARASGWLAPDPHPVVVSAQRAGIIRSLSVRSGQAVSAGEVIAELDPRDADLAVQRAESAMAIALTAVRQAEATHQRHRAEVAAAQARVDQATDRRDRLERAGLAVTDNDRSQAKLEVATRQAELAVATAAVAEAEAAIHAARTRVQTAEIDQAAAALERTRCTITAPVTGIVLRVVAAPGHHVSVEDGDTARLIELFDPTAVQVRADIPLGDAGGVRPGQPVEIDCDLLPGRMLRGRVSSLAGEADAARNTLQAHIAILDPPPGLRPEMLARVRVLSDPTRETATTNSPGATTPSTASRSQLLVPSAGVHGDGEQTYVWLVDIDRRLRRRPVILAGTAHNGWTPIADGLFLGDPIVITPTTELTEGRRVHPTFGTTP